MLVIDDHLLLALLLERPTRAFERLRAGKRVFTTGLWYHRMCRALTASEVSGALGAQLGAVEPAVARQAIAAAIELPPTIGLVSLRDLSWPMAEILTSIPGVGSLTAIELPRTVGDGSASPWAASHPRGTTPPTPDWRPRAAAASPGKRGATRSITSVNAVCDRPDYGACRGHRG